MEPRLRPNERASKQRRSLFQKASNRSFAERLLRGIYGLEDETVNPATPIRVAELKLGLLRASDRG